jgi:hypothetical protein
VKQRQPEHTTARTVTHRHCGVSRSEVRRRWGRQPASVVLDGNLRTGNPSGEQRRWPTWSDHSGGAVNLPARAMATGWRGDIDRGGEVAASDRPDWNGRAYKGTRHHRVGRRVASTCPASYDRRAQVEGTVTDKWAVGLDFSTCK